MRWAFSCSVQSSARPRQGSTPPDREQGRKNTGAARVSLVMVARSAWPPRAPALETRVCLVREAVGKV